MGNKRPRRDDRLILKLNEEDIWSNPDRTWREWAAKVDAHPESVRAAFKREGWVRDSRGKEWITAPCRFCESTFDAAKLNQDQLCGKCRNPDRDFYEQELRSFLERNPNMSSYIERSL